MTARAADRFRRQPASGSDLRVFFLESLRSLPVTASLCPSSRFLASALLRAIDFATARIVVELGSGTGAVTSELLRCLSPNAKLYALDINPIFVSHLRRRIRDPRLITIQGGAEHLSSILAQRGVHRADAIVSSLGLTSMAKAQRSTIVGQAAKLLSKRGVLTQFQYLHASAAPDWFSAIGLPRFSAREFLREHFRHVSSETVLRNIPPAAVYTCRSHSAADLVENSTAEDAANDLRAAGQRADRGRCQDEAACGAASGQLPRDWSEVSR